MEYTIEEALDDFFLEVGVNIYGDDDEYKLFGEFAVKEGFSKEDADTALERYYEDVYESNLSY